MENSTEVTFFILAAYGDLGGGKYFYFIVVLLLSLTIIFANITLIVLIFVDRTLHEPMYVFLCNLFLNELYGNSAVYPVLLLHILSDTHEISRAFCLVQYFCLYSYGSMELCNSAVMAYDRYVAICHPLHYSRRMTSCKVYSLVVFTWVFSFLNFTVILSLQLRLPLCGNIVYKLYCSSSSFIKLSCDDTMRKHFYKLTATVLLLSIPLIPILYSYARIIRICFKSPKEAQTKALNTCIPQVLSLLNFVLTGVFEIVLNQFDMTYVPRDFRNVFVVITVSWAQFLNPIIYGVKMTKIRKSLKNLFFPNSVVRCVTDN